MSNNITNPAIFLKKSTGDLTRKNKFPVCTKGNADLTFNVG